MKNCFNCYYFDPIEIQLGDKTIIVYCRYYRDFKEYKFPDVICKKWQTSALCPQCLFRYPNGSDPLGICIHCRTVLEEDKQSFYGLIKV